MSENKYLEIDHEELTDYMFDCGWRLEYLGEGYKVYTKAGPIFRRSFITVYVDPTSDKYQRSIEAAIERIARLENTTFAQIHNKILADYVDTSSSNPTYESSKFKVIPRDDNNVTERKECTMLKNNYSKIDHEALIGYMIDHRWDLDFITSEFEGFYKVDGEGKRFTVTICINPESVRYLQSIETVIEMIARFENITTLQIYDKIMSDYTASLKRSHESSKFKATPIDKDNKKTGIKHDAGKPEFGYAHSSLITELAKAHQAGAIKYEKYNYLLGLSSTRLLNAAARHLWAYMEGEDNDKDTTEILGKDVSHLGCLLACINMLLSCKANGTLEDDRKKR